MSNPQLIPFKKAKLYVDAIVKLLQPHCILIDIAGSIRRECPEVKDIEVVCQPQKISRDADLFGHSIATMVVPAFSSAIDVFAEKIIKGNVEGRQMQIEIKGGIILDLFMPQPFDYYRILAMRTGSADYSHDVIAYTWRKLGWVGTSEGLRRQKDCMLKKDKWICTAAKPELPPRWRSEQDFFQWLGLECIHPSDRNYKSALKV